MSRQPTAPTKVSPPGSPFRPAALEAYRARHQEPVVLDAIPERLFRRLWLIVAALIVALVIVGAPFWLA